MTCKEDVIRRHDRALKRAKNNSRLSLWFWHLHNTQLTRWKMFMIQDSGWKAIEVKRCKRKDRDDSKIRTRNPSEVVSSQNSEASEESQFSLR